MFELIPLVGFLGVLLYNSIYDMKYRHIPTWTVVILFVLAPIYIYTAGIDTTTASFCFLYMLLAGLVFYIMGKGGFGIGDVLIFALLGWIIADFDGLDLYIFRVFLPVFVVFIGFSLVYYYRKYGSLKDYLHGFRRLIFVEELETGMVLGSDNVMKGLTEADIVSIQDQAETCSQMEVKEPLPFIPVIFVSACLYFMISLVENPFL